MSIPKIAVLCALAMSAVSSWAGPKIMPIKRMSRGIHWKVAQPSVLTTANLKYYGGPVLSQVKVVSVYWGANVDHTVRAGMGGFYQALVNSPMMDMLGEYNTTINSVSGKPGTNQTITRGSFAGDVQITPSVTSTNLNDTDVQAEIEHQIAIGVLPKQDSNTLYMMHFPPGVSIQLDMGGQSARSCEQFCGYHYGFNDKAGQPIIYGVMPDFTTGGCAYGCGTGSAFENLTSASSHEVVEAITDTDIGFVTGDNLDFPAGWYDPDQNMEIGDICAYSSTGQISSDKGIQYTIQSEWSNRQNRCAFAP